MDKYMKTEVFPVVFGGLSLMLTDIRTARHTDRPSYRNARTHLKTKITITQPSFLCEIEA